MGISWTHYVKSAASLYTGTMIMIVIIMLYYTGRVWSGLRESRESLLYRSVGLYV